MIFRRSAVRCAAAILFLAAAFAAPSMSMAQSAIRVLVNDEPITSFDIQQRAKMMSVFSRGRQGEDDAVEQLISERLMLQEAERRSVEITDAQVEESFAERARGVNLTADRFSAALRQAGINPETFKDFLRANMAWAEVVRARFRAQVKVTDQDVTAALTGRDAAAAEAQTAFEYRLQQIIFVIPEGAGAGAEAQRRNEASAFRSGFQGCDNALQQAAGMSGVVVKPQIRREQGQLSEKMKEALASLEVGSTTEPDRVAEGIQIVAICARTEIAGQSEATTEVREELSSERGELLARRYLRDLRSDAVIEYR